MGTRILTRGLSLLALCSGSVGSASKMVPLFRNQVTRESVTHKSDVAKWERRWNLRDKRVQDLAVDVSAHLPTGHPLREILDRSLYTITIHKHEPIAIDGKRRVHELLLEHDGAPASVGKIVMEKTNHRKKEGQIAEIEDIYGNKLVELHPKVKVTPTMIDATAALRHVLSLVKAKLPNHHPIRELSVRHIAFLEATPAADGPQKGLVPFGDPLTGETLGYASIRPGDTRGSLYRVEDRAGAPLWSFEADKIKKMLTLQGWKKDEPKRKKEVPGAGKKSLDWQDQHQLDKFTASLHERVSLAKRQLPTNHLIQRVTTWNLKLVPRPISSQDTAATYLMYDAADPRHTIQGTVQVSFPADGKQRRVEFEIRDNYNAVIWPRPLTVASPTSSSN